MIATTPNLSYSENTMETAIEHSEVQRAVRPYLPASSPTNITPISTGRFNTSFFVTGQNIEWVIRIAPLRDSVFIFLVDANNKVTGLIDWDRALYGDPEIEYAVLDVCGISKPAFWEG